MQNELRKWAWVGLGEMRGLSERCIYDGHLGSWIIHSKIKEFMEKGSLYRRRGERAQSTGTKANVLMLLEARKSPIGRHLTLCAKPRDKSP